MFSSSPPRLNDCNSIFWPNRPLTIWRRSAQRTSAASKMGSLVVSALSSKVVAIGTISFSDTFSASKTRNTRSNWVWVSALSSAADSFGASAVRRSIIADTSSWVNNSGRYSRTIFETWVAITLDTSITW